MCAGCRMTVGCPRRGEPRMTLQQGGPSNSGHALEQAPRDDLPRCDGRRAPLWYPLARMIPSAALAIALSTVASATGDFEFAIRADTRSSLLAPDGTPVEPRAAA